MAITDESSTIQASAATFHPLERGFYQLFRLSTFGTSAVIIWFSGYVIIGYTLHIAGVYEPEFVVMSMIDPLFVIPSFIGGVFICAMSGSLTLLTSLMDVRDANAFTGNEPAVRSAEILNGVSEVVGPVLNNEGRQIHQEYDW